jgi:hypothetical protein
MQVAGAAVCKFEHPGFERAKEMGQCKPGGKRL